MPLLVTGVYRRGGEWRNEGEVAGIDRTIEIDVSAAHPAPDIGTRLGARIDRARLFHTGEQPCRTMLSSPTCRPKSACTEMRRAGNTVAETYQARRSPNP